MYRISKPNRQNVGGTLDVKWLSLFFLKIISQSYVNLIITLKGPYSKTQQRKFYSIPFPVKHVKYTSGNFMVTESSKNSSNIHGFHHFFGHHDLPGWKVTAILEEEAQIWMAGGNALLRKQTLFSIFFSFLSIVIVLINISWYVASLNLRFYIYIVDINHRF